MSSLSSLVGIHPPVLLHLALSVSFALTSVFSSVNYFRSEPANCTSAHFTEEQKLYLVPCYDWDRMTADCYPRIFVEDMKKLDDTLMIFYPARTYDGKPFLGIFNTQEEQLACTPILALFGSTLVMLGNCSPHDLRVGAYIPLLCSRADFNRFYDHYTMIRSGLFQLNCTVLNSGPASETLEDIEFTKEEIRFYMTWEENGDASYDVCGTRCDNHRVRGRSCPYLYDFDRMNDYTPPGIHQTTSLSEARPPLKKNRVRLIGLLTVLVSVFLLFFSLFLHRRLKKSILCRRKRSRKGEDLEVLLQKLQNLVPTRYSYTDVVKITSSFCHKLGRGGYGSVYRGQLEDGRPVAAKVLNDSKGSVKDFFTEVISICCTYHVNIVTLLGFCSEGPNRVLLYEFMPNGSLEKFIYREKTESSTLDPAKLLDIAIGVARGLEYLHHGCSIGILHFDIKPHNILLDHDLRPKIADFGLAKLCRSADSRIRMLGARGTIGYIAPEVFSRHYGGVSSKSDVYSYGMMILEMVGGRKNSSVHVDNTSEVYFPHWICKHLDLDGNMKTSLRSMTGDEAEIARRMVIVGLWCIQTKPSDRPSMTKVLDMLEGRITELQMPPMPVLSSPPRSPPLLHSLTIPSHEIAVSTVSLARD